MHNGKAGAGRRLAAFALDYLLIACYAVGLTVVSFAMWRLTRGGAATTAEAEPWLFDLVAFATLVLPVTLYFSLSEASKRQATWGKRKVGLVVVSSGGRPLGVGRSMLRSGVKFLPWQIAHSSLFAIPGWPTNVETIPSAAAAGLVLSLSLAILYVSSLALSRGGWTVYDRLARTEVRVRKC